MKLVVAAVFCCLVAIGFSFHVPNVLKFVPHHANFKSDVESLLQLLGKNHLPERYVADEEYSKYGLDPKVKLTEFKYENCGDPKKELMVLNSLKISPDPIKMQSEMDVSFNLKIIKKVAGPVKADVVMQKKIVGEYVKLPCIDNVGSCNYDDVCSLLSQIPQCPLPFITSGVPCQCPFAPGVYKMTRGAFSIPYLPLPSGDYKISANMTTKQDSVGCYVINLSIA